MRLSGAPDKAHVFRKFEEAAPDHREADLAMKWIGELYAAALPMESVLRVA